MSKERTAQRQTQGRERSKRKAGGWRWLPGMLALLAIGGGQGSAQGQSFEANPAYHAARGPISIRDMRPYNLLFLQFLPESPDILPRKANQFGLQLDVANNMLIPRPNGGVTVVEDNEYQRFFFFLAAGVG